MKLLARARKGQEQPLAEYVHSLKLTAGDDVDGQLLARLHRLLDHGRQQLEDWLAEQDEADQRAARKEE